MPETDNYPSVEQVWNLFTLVTTLFFFFKAFEYAKGLHRFWNRCSPAKPCLYCNEVRVLFFPDEKLPCNSSLRKLMPDRRDLPKYCNRRDCEYWHGHRNESSSSLFQIYTLLTRAKKQIDLCMFRVSHRRLAEILRHRKERGIRVRVITDSSVDEGDQISSIQDAGIEVKSNINKFEYNNVQNYKPLMHNKFVLVDGKTVMMGSFNWTYNATTKNDESIIIARASTVVGDFVTKFESMWNDSSRYAHH